MKRDAQQSPDCEHSSKSGNTAWRHEAPLHRLAGRRAWLARHGRFLLLRFLFTCKKMKRRSPKSTPAWIRLLTLILSKMLMIWGFKVLGLNPMWVLKIGADVRQQLPSAARGRKGHAGGIAAWAAKIIGCILRVSGMGQHCFGPLPRCALSPQDGSSPAIGSTPAWPGALRSSGRGRQYAGARFCG